MNDVTITICCKFRRMIFAKIYKRIFAVLMVLVMVFGAGGTGTVLAENRPHGAAANGDLARGGGEAPGQARGDNICYN